MNVLDSLTALQSLPMDSMDSMNGVPESPSTNCLKGKPLTTVACVVEAINCVYKNIPKENWEKRREMLTKILTHTNLSVNDVGKYTLFDKNLPYTRNLVATDGFNYGLLVLCWNGGMESKIHNHPCDGCFVKVLRGTIKETRYSYDQQTDAITLLSEFEGQEGDVAYMDDFVGLHKIGNPSKDVGAVTLHLYTPPYSLCKVMLNYSSSNFHPFRY